MSPPGAGAVKKAVVQRAAGNRLGPLHALGVAVIVGAGSAVLTYRLLRSGDD
jgi:hypothetical protein